MTLKHVLYPRMKRGFSYIYLWFCNIIVNNFLTIDVIF